MNNRVRKQRLVLLAVLLLVLLVYPVITAASKPRLVMGIPLLYLYVFVVWGAGIFLLVRLSVSKKNRRDE